jgi:hypothetical protein
MFIRSGRGRLLHGINNSRDANKCRDARQHQGHHKKKETPVAEETLTAVGMEATAGGPGPSTAVETTATAD